MSYGSFVVLDVYKKIGIWKNKCYFFKGGVGLEEKLILSLAEWLIHL
jgi:hypothetical protein